MPYQRPNPADYATNGSAGTIKHGNPVSMNGFVGTAVKQKSVPWALGLAAQDQIQPAEQFLVLTKGEVQVDNVSGFAKGDPVYIAPASVSGGVTTFALTESASGNAKYGVVVEVVGDGRGVPTGKVRIDLDKKDQF